MHWGGLRCGNATRAFVVCRIFLWISRRSPRSRPLTDRRVRKILDCAIEPQRDRQHCTDNVLLRTQLPSFCTVLCEDTSICFLRVGDHNVSDTLSNLNSPFLNSPVQLQSHTHLNRWCSSLLRNADQLSWVDRILGLLLHSSHHRGAFCLPRARSKARSKIPATATTTAQARPVEERVRKLRPFSVELTLSSSVGDRGNRGERAQLRRCSAVHGPGVVRGANREKDRGHRV